MKESCSTTGGRPCGLPLNIVASTVVRFVLGPLFIFSGMIKLGITNFAFLGEAGRAMTPRDFYFSVKAFQMGLPDWAMQFLTFSIPWAEVIAGALLLLGLFARGAALVIALLMVSFILGIISLLARGLDVNCPCFGSLKLFCSGPLGLCHIVRNLAFAAAAAHVIYHGPGPASLDRAWLRRE